MKLLKIIFGRNTILYVVLSCILCFALRYNEVLVSRHEPGISGKSNRVAKSIYGDGQDYLMIANTIKEHGIIGREKYLDSTLGNIDIVSYLSQKNQPATVPGQSQAFRPPLWPIVLSGILALSHSNLYLVFIIKFLLDVCAVVLFSFLVDIFNFKKEWKNMAILFFAINPVWLFYSCTLLSESFTMLLILLFSLLELNIIRRGSWRILELTVLGLLGGLIILSHPSYLLFVAFSGLALLFYNKTQFLKIAVFYIAVAVPTGIWVVRNMNVYHTHEILLSLNGVIYAKSWNSAVATEYNNKAVGASDPLLDLPKYYPNINLDTCSEYSRFTVLKNTALSFARDNTMLLPKILIRKLVCNLDPHPEKPEKGVLPLLSTLYRTLALVSFLLVLVFIRKIDRNFLVVFIPVMLSFILTGLIFLSEFRFQLPKLGIETISIFIALQQLLLLFRPGAQKKES